MQSHRSLPLSLSLLVLPLFVACGEADDGDMTDPLPTATGTNTAPVVPGTVNPTPPVTSQPPAPVAPTTPATSSAVNPPPIPPATSSPPVIEPPPPDPWTEVYGIFQANCGGGTFCHGALQMPPQLFGDEATVRPLAEMNVVKIVNRTVTLKTMPAPPDGPLPQAEQDAIQAWANSLTP